ncbi:MAG: peptidyl-prolyl cis-trans isomerase [Ignavibacteriae bacterium]|nr:peptidyl-prolyl cis-trans isomerase [Ignavibacteriota bacterium]MCB9260530.1 peptidyl-prolyl cis-trans isomerase [Ignavibacteriales bacterium]
MGLINLRKLVLLVSMFLLLFACSEKKIDDAYVVQIDKAGLRKGVFERRFKLSNDYGKNTEFSVETLKNFIDKTLLPEYLFIEKAYDLGFDQDPQIKNSVLELKMNALASNHPIHSKDIFLSDESVIDFYNNKSDLYDFDIIQNSSYYLADSMYKFLEAGNKLQKENEAKSNMFPRTISYLNKSYGETVPKDIFDKIEEMQVGDISKPIYTPPVWAIVKLNKKLKNNLLLPIDDMKQTLIKELQNYEKVEQVKKFTQELKNKYQLEIVNVDYNKLIEAFVITEDQHGYFNRTKYDGSPSDIIIFNTTKGSLNLDQFFFLFNRANQFSQLVKVVKEDLEVFINDLADQFVLYIDALDENIESEESVADQIENKLNRSLLTKFLKEQISEKINLSDNEVKKYYDEHRDKWQGEFDVVKSSLINEMRKSRMYEYRDNLINNYKEEYSILYNQKVLQELAEKFTKEKINPNSK